MRGVKEERVWGGVQLQQGRQCLTAYASAAQTEAMLQHVWLTDVIAVATTV